MGVGYSLEASHVLHAPIRAGEWRLSADGILVGENPAAKIDVRFQILWRRANEPAGSGTVLVRFDHRFERDPERRFAAVRYAASADGIAAPARPGDLLVLRVIGVGGDADALYILNGDGGRTGGEIPNITLPR